MKMSAPRSGWVDALKGAAILLLVLGHTIGGLTSSTFVPEENREVLKSIYRWIYSFHMPVFMIASGLFAYRSLEKSGFQLFVNDKACSLLYPYFIWGMLTWICHHAARSWTNSQPNPMVPLQLFYKPDVGPWFLYVLAILMLSLAVWVRFGGNRLSFFVLWLVVFFAGLLTDVCELPIVLMRLSELGIWFAFGILSANGILAIGHKISLPGLLSLVTVGFGLQTLAFVQKWDQHYLLSALPSFFGSLGLFAIAVLTERLAIDGFFRLCGRASLEIYVAGGLAEVPARILLFRMFGVKSALIHVFCGTVAGIAWPLLLKVMCRRFHCEFLFRCPIPLKTKTSNPDLASEE